MATIGGHSFVWGPTCRSVSSTKPGIWEHFAIRPHRTISQCSSWQGSSFRLRSRYGQQLKELQHRYYDVGARRYAGGIAVADYLNMKSGALMFAS